MGELIDLQEERKKREKVLKPDFSAEIGNVIKKFAKGLLKAMGWENMEPERIDAMFRLMR